MVNVDGEKIEVPDPNAWNLVLMEERFDLLRAANRCTQDGWKQLSCNDLPTKGEDVYICMSNLPCHLGPRCHSEATLPPGPAQLNRQLRTSE